MQKTLTEVIGQNTTYSDPDPCQTTTVTILDGQSLSGAADLRALGAPVAIITDAAWDTNAVTFQLSVDGVLYTDLRSGATEVGQPAVVASAITALNPFDFLAARYIKVRSGTSAAPVVQAGDTVVTIVARPFA